MYLLRKERKGRKQFNARQKGLKFALYLLGSNEADIPFFVNRKEFVVPDCLRQYLGLAVRCRKHDLLPMVNNLFVKFRKMAIKIKKVVIIITYIERAKCRQQVERNNFGKYFHGASESEHSRPPTVYVVIST